MARSIEEISTQIQEAILAHTELSGLTSTSQTAVWAQLKDVYAYIQNLNEQLADVELVALNKIADEAVPGTPAWLQRQVFKFQYGDLINLNSDLTFSYPTVDASKRIITRCSVQQLDETREVLLKVAQGSTNATLAPLTLDQLSSLRAYINRIKFAGTHILPVSLESDKIVTNMTVYYAGEYVAADVKTAVIDAITAFYQALPFDGTLYLSKLVDAVQAVQGVNDVVLTSATARPDTTPLGDPTLQPIPRFYNAQAGYIVAETAAGNTLDDTIDLIATE